jgi:hypothetical protein
MENSLNYLIKHIPHNKRLKPFKDLQNQKNVEWLKKYFLPEIMQNSAAESLWN